MNLKQSIFIIFIIMIIAFLLPLYSEGIFFSLMNAILFGTITIIGLILGYIIAETLK